MLTPFPPYQRRWALVRRGLGQIDWSQVVCDDTGNCVDQSNGNIVSYGGTDTSGAPVITDTSGAPVFGTGLPGALPGSSIPITTNIPGVPGAPAQTSSQNSAMTQLIKALSTPSTVSPQGLKTPTAQSQAASQQQQLTNQLTAMMSILLIGAGFLMIMMMASKKR